jgi:hypothetical protein
MVQLDLGDRCFMMDSHGVRALVGAVVAWMTAKQGSLVQSTSAFAQGVVDVAMVVAGA